MPTGMATLASLVGDLDAAKPRVKAVRRML
jgi:hypothetical protein